MFSILDLKLKLQGKVFLLRLFLVWSLNHSQRMLKKSLNLFFSTKFRSSIGNPVIIYFHIGVATRIISNKEEQSSLRHGGKGSVFLNNQVFVFQRGEKFVLSERAEIVLFSRALTSYMIRKLFMGAGWLISGEWKNLWKKLFAGEYIRRSWSLTGFHWEEQMKHTPLWQAENAERLPLYSMRRWNKWKN